MPEFLGKVLSHVAPELVTDPLHVKDIARAIRVADMFACGMDGDLSQCGNLRHLPIMDMGQAEFAENVKETAKDLELADQSGPDHHRCG